MKTLEYIAVIALVALFGLLAARHLWKGLAGRGPRTCGDCPVRGSCATRDPEACGEDDPKDES